MKKNVLLIVGLAIGLLLLIGGVIASKVLSVPPAEVAYLTIRTGGVEVSSGGNWLAASDGMKLSEKHRIRTGKSGEAVITFFESAIVELGPNTEVAVGKSSLSKVAVRLEEGSVWNKVLKIGGLKEYEVSTPNSVATVRGTEFGVDYNKSEGESWLTVGEGEVEFDNFKEKVMVGKGKRFSTKRDKIVELVIDKQVRQKMRKKMAGTLDNMKQLRMNMVREVIESNKFLIGQLSRQNNIDSSKIDEIVARGLADADAGRINEDELLGKVPVRIEALYKLRDLNREIRNQIEIVGEEGEEK